MKVSLRAAVENFDAGQFSDLEYGISDEDTAQGLRDTFKSVGIEWDEDCLFYCGQLESPAERKKRLAADRKRARERLAWRKANPEEAALQDNIEAQLAATSAALMDRLLADLIKPNPFFAVLTGKAGSGVSVVTKDSPNWKSYSDELKLTVEP